MEAGDNIRVIGISRSWRKSRDKGMSQIGQDMVPMKWVSKMIKRRILTTGMLSAFFSATTFIVGALPVPSSKSIVPAENKIE
jgi:hypothetical protein